MLVIFSLGYRLADGNGGQRITHPERSTIRHSNRQVGDNGKQPVGGRRAEGQVVGDLVDSQEEVLVAGGAEDVAREPELPREEGGVAQEMGEQELEGDDAEDDPFR